MKHLLSSFLLSLLCVGISLTGYTQENKDQMFAVYMHKIMPAKVMQYEQAIKGIVKMHHKHHLNVPGVHTIVSDEFEYVYLIPRENMAALDQSPIGEMVKTMDEDQKAYNDLWASANECVVDQSSSTSSFSAELSYVHESNEESDDQLARKWTIYHIMPGKIEAAKKISAKFKALYKEKGAPARYQTFLSGFGSNGPAILVATWGENQAEIEANSQKVNEMVGDAGMALWQEALPLIREVEVHSGMYRTDLSYLPEMEMAKE